MILKKNRQLNFLFLTKCENFLRKGIKKILEKKERQIKKMITGKEYLSSYSTRKKMDKNVTIEKFKKRSMPSIKGIKLNLLNSRKLFWFLLDIFN